MADFIISRGLQASYNAISTKNADTIYVATDTGHMYLGDSPLTDHIIFDKPATGVKGNIYVQDGTWAWDGTDYVALGADVTTIVSDVANLKTRMGTAESDITALEADMTTAKGNITSLTNDKADKATTLAGYGIGDAYTKTQTDSKIAEAVANADHLKRAIVDNLPEVASADANTIYMVKKTGGSGEQQYDEYMLINGAFEKIGDSAVNLSGYATETWVTQQITPVSNKVTANETAIATLNGTGDGSVTKAVNDAKTAAVTEAKEYADSLAGNYATAAQGTKADSAVQKAQVTSGSANGTIAVQGTDVAVKGLGSAAYAATSAFDAAGKADQALADAKTYADSLKLQWGTF